MERKWKYFNKCILLLIFIIFLVISIYLIIAIMNDLSIINKLSPKSSHLIYYEQRTSIYGIFLTSVLTTAAIIGALLGINIQIENSNNQLKNQNKTDLNAKFSMDKIKDTKKLSNSIIELYKESSEIISMLEFVEKQTKLNKSNININKVDEELKIYNNNLSIFWFDKILTSNITVITDLREELLKFRKLRGSIIGSINSFYIDQKINKNNQSTQKILENIKNLKEYINPEYLYYNKEKEKDNLFVKIMHEKNHLENEINNYIDKHR